MAGLVVDGHPILVYIINHRVLHRVGFRRQNPAAFVFHHLVGAGAVEAGEGSALLRRHGILSLVPVAPAVGGGQNGHFCQIFPGQPVQAGLHPLRFQPGLLFIVHVPEIAAAAQLGHGALPVHPVGGFFQNFQDFSRCPGFPGILDAQPHPLPGDGVGQEHGAALHMGNALTLGSVIRDHRLINSVLFQHQSLASM